MPPPITRSSIRQAAPLACIAGLLAASGQYACTDDSCNTLRTASYQTFEEISAHRIETLGTALARQDRSLTRAQQDSLARDGHVFGVVGLDRPVKHPDGQVEMPPNWLPPIPDGHPWAKPLTPADEAFYSWFEERIVEARLFDPENPIHIEWARAYLARATAPNGSFRSWTYASSTDCK